MVKDYKERLRELSERIMSEALKQIIYKYIDTAGNTMRLKVSITKEKVFYYNQHNIIESLEDLIRTGARPADFKAILISGIEEKGAREGLDIVREFSKNRKWEIESKR